MDKIVVFCLPILLLLAGVITWFFLRKTIRTRIRVGHQLQQDPDINEWLVVFNWSRKVLYVPTILASLSAGVLMCFFSVDSMGAAIIGGCWLVVFFLNFLVDEYEISIKVLLILLLMIMLGGLWLGYLGWLRDFLGVFRHLKVLLSPAGYFVIAGIFLLAIVIAWVRGLFYYVAITPNYMNIQTGPTETGEQFNHTDYSTQVDTGDFLERLLGFGRIIVTFRDHRKAPMSMLVGGVGKKAQRLESIRGTLSVERYSAGQEASYSD